MVVLVSVGVAVVVSLFELFRALSITKAAGTIEAHRGRSGRRVKLTQPST
jgi:hypothetical protein